MVLLFTLFTVTFYVESEMIASMTIFGYLHRNSISESSHMHFERSKEVFRDPFSASLSETRRVVLSFY